MSLISFRRHLVAGLHVLMHRTVADQELSDEVQHYLEEATAAHVARGLSADQAYRAAQREIGNLTAAREQVRAYGWENAVGTLLADLAYATRRLRRQWGFTATGVLTLALGIGATTAIFSVVNPILFESLPYPRADRILMLSDIGRDGSRIETTAGTYREVAARSRSFSAIAVVDQWRPTLTGAAEPERLGGERVSATYFRTLGVPPAHGRDFIPADEGPDRPRVVILSDGIVLRRFAGDSAMVGRRISLNGDEYTVIGVMPAGFENVLAPGAEVWAPQRYRFPATFNGPEWGHHYTMIGRLQPDVTIDRANRELNIIAHTPVSEFPRPPWANMLPGGLAAHPLQDDMTHSVRAALVSILGAALLVLAIACVNVTNLLLARSKQRRGELALRSALGAGRRRLIQQVLTETACLASVGAALGLGVAEVGVRGLVALSPPGLPRVGAIRLDAAGFMFALGITILVTLVVGLAPALDASRDDLHAELQGMSRRTTGRGLMGRVLVVTEVAFALMLLVSAGLLLRSLDHLFSVAPGFDPSHTLTMQVVQAGHRYDTDSARYRFYDEVAGAVRHVPGVSAAAFTSQLPLSGDADLYGYEYASIPSQSKSASADGSAFRYAVTPDYFRAMRIPIRSGRVLDTRDRAGGPEVVVISESFAKRKFPGGDAIGQRVRFGPEISNTSRGWGVVVGVVGDVKQQSLTVDQPDAFYVASGQWVWVDNVQSLIVRVTGDPTPLIPAIRNAIWSVDKNQPIVRVATMEALVAATAGQRRFALTLFEAFALAALLLAAIGIYGILSGSVTDRMRELGVRAALGATAGDVLGLVLRQGMTLAALGAVIGLAGAVVASRVITTLLFGVSRLDPTTYVGVIALLAAVSAAACILPAWRAARVDPASTLRAD